MSALLIPATRQSADVPASTLACGGGAASSLELAASTRCDPSRPAPARVLLLGCGTVGSALAARLLQVGPSLGVELSRVLVRDTSRDRGVPRRLLTSSFEEALAEKPDLVIEVLGGTEPARVIVRTALLHGIPVVTANKTLIARHGAELDDAARRGRTRIVHEAAVCAAIPVFAALRHLEGDRVRRLIGIVNGSCNFILSRLSRGDTYEAALREAAARGLVEPDPTADVSGRDSAEKLVLLARACGPTDSPTSLFAGPARRAISVDDVDISGITAIRPEDILAARRGGHVIKLLAEFDPVAGVLRVGPTLVPNGHVLAGVNDEENAVVIETELAGPIVLRGKGAGPRPTISAILGDVLRVRTRPGMSEDAARARPASSSAPAAEPRSQAADFPVAPGGPPALRRACHARVDAPGIDPTDLLDRLRARSIAVGELSIARSGARLTTPDGDPRQLAALLAGLAPGRAASLLVMPVLNRDFT